MCHVTLLYYEFSSCDTDIDDDEMIDAPEMFAGTSMHCVQWPTIFMIYNIAASDENDETLQAGNAPYKGLVETKKMIKDGSKILSLLRYPTCSQTALILSSSHLQKNEKIQVMYLANH